ncbi:cytochrome o ubiquinol oxidase subunit IV [Tanticharoenia sakaeratensis]|jgi:cytochrome o ubiquinol oxidase subunit IV|uniref:Cytochrome bo(3) ubiquinol oxidase subunit 4 n=1 Tax=Tanticharoenia sakaeratensis NBRC 103193 TaxID=1231623 RepID=A0A0D6MKB5_9PROT|nr:cytochrome o ubiquinol oxidase subunit IV [Tanticharoenia sakaeratensis]GAN53885.1 cytochrome o ubiquinol oxidase subunit IV [Tanticharoenia sakaeratensis NBRC 103193]GBQ25172.1 cytochrome o ubiquinol oxidase subunit IV [Tanticharoenia sakaeratensis NBRC 103193]
MAQAHLTTPAGESHGSYGSYFIGFVLSVVLTAAAFAIVMMHGMSPTATIGAIAALAVIQVLVHLVFFLHLSTNSESRWNTMAFVFTVISVILLVGGTLFIMHDTSVNMMSR